MAYDLVAKLSLVDKLSAPLRKATSNIDKAGKQATAAGGNFKRMGDVGKSALDRINISAGTLLKTFAAVEIARKSAEFIGDSLKKSMDFEAEMSSIQALTGATSEQMAEMQKLALDMGAKTKYSAMQAAQGIEELLKSGIDPATVKAGALEAALTLATAGGLELKDAAEIMSTSLNAFVKDGMKAADAANILAGTANASATDVSELKFALSSVGAVAGGIGLSFKDTNTALGVLANRALKGSDAGTSLKTMLQNLQPQTKDQVKLFDKLGITTNGTANKFFTAKGKIQSFEKITGVLHDSMKDMTDMQRQAALEVMFGSDAVRAATIIFDTGADGVRNFAEEMTKVSALDVAKKKMDNAAGAVEQFKGALETLQISGLMPVLPMLKNFANAAADFVTKYTPQITAAIQRMVDNAKGYMLAHFINNPEFNKLTTLEAKIGFVIDDIESVIGKWWTSTGQSKFEDLAAKLTSTIATGIENNAGTITSAATKLGASIGSGMAKGLEEEAAKHPLLMMAAGGLAGFRLGGIWGGVAGVIGGAGAAAKAQADVTSSNKAMGVTDPSAEPMVDAAAAWNDMINNPDGVDSRARRHHAGGLSRVPYNGYSATLHKDEEVLTKADADARRSGNYGRSVLVTGNTFNVRQESDIDAIANALALQLNASVAWGG